MRLLKFLLPVLVLAMGAGGYHYFKKNRVEPEPIVSRVRPPVVAAKEVRKDSVAPQLTLFGQVEAPRNSILTAGIAADVLEVAALEGSAVSVGDVLVRLDDIDVALESLQRKAEISEIEAQLESDLKRYAADKASLANEKSLLALSRKAVERNRTLARSSAGTEATLDTALQQEEQQKLSITQRQLSIDDFASRQKLWQARLEKAEAVYQRTLRDQQRSTIKAPFGGRIVKVMVSAGDRTSAGTQLVQLYDDQQLEIRAQIPSRYLPALQQALDLSEVLSARMLSNNDSINLSLHRLSSSVAQGQGGVDAFFRAPGERFPALGKTVEVALTLPLLNNVITLSPDALYGADRVYRIKDDTLEAVMVKRLGQTFDQDGRQQLIVDGAVFADGDKVLSSRLPQAIEGLKVEIREPDGSGN